MRHIKEVYCFITDENNMFYSATQNALGEYIIESSGVPKPISFNPSNILDIGLELGTNETYNSLARSVGNRLDFVKDSAAILRDFYYNKDGINSMVYFTIIKWNGDRNLYELSLRGRLDISEKKEDPKIGQFSCPLVDDSAWADLDKNDSVKYSIDASRRNPKAIKVIIDGMTLLDNFTFQTVQSTLVDYRGSKSANNEDRWYPIPFVLINQDGDSYGLTTKDQTSEKFGSEQDLLKGSSWFFSTAFNIPNLRLKGSFNFKAVDVMNHQPGSLMAINVYFLAYSEEGQPTQRFNLFGTETQEFKSITETEYEKDFDFIFDLPASYKLYLIVLFRPFQYNIREPFGMTFQIRNTSVLTKTTTEPAIVYALRPLDLGRELVRKGTAGKRTLNSDFFTTNNKTVAVAGTSFRGIENSLIYSSFADYYKSYNAIFFLALKTLNDSLFIEKTIDVYNNDNLIVDIGEANDVTLIAAKDKYFNEIQVGSPKQDYRQSSGRLEFNSVNTFSIDFRDIEKKYDLVSVYRFGCYDVIFQILNHQGGSTKDATADNAVFLLQITDDLISAKDDVETFENVTISNQILEPIIKTPLDNSFISSLRPTVTGVGMEGESVNIFLDRVLAGSTVVNSDGNWAFSFVEDLQKFVENIYTGEHVIAATYSNLGAPSTSINVIIDTTAPQIDSITYPSNNESLYNNMPLIRGFAEAGKVLDVILNGMIIASVTADGSCYWSYKIGANFDNVIPNGVNLLEVGTASVSFNVNSFTEHPLITYIGGELDGFPIVDNTPLIRGVGMPSTEIKVWLNYDDYAPLGTTFTTPSGNWSFQTSPMTHPDRYSGLPVTVVPIQNGLNVFSTLLVNKVVKIDVIGYKLSRPDYDYIRGVPDNTVFNTELSPRRMLDNHRPMISAVTDDIIRFQTADKNREFETSLDGVIIKEAADIRNISSTTPFARLDYVNVTTKTLSTFAKALNNFNGGGNIKFNFRGFDIYCLPIGGMKMSSITSEVQTWKLLVSYMTLKVTLSNLYKNAITVSIRKNSISHSDYNSLHFVKYSTEIQNKYHSFDMYSELSSNRNSAWTTNPSFAQKWQFDDLPQDQIISNGVMGLVLDLYECGNEIPVRSFIYDVVPSSPLNAPETLWQANISFAELEQGMYYGILKDDESNLICITEPLDIRATHFKTILIEAYSSLNKPGYFFSTGITSIMRINGIIKRPDIDIKTFDSEDESGDTVLLHSIVKREFEVRMGDAFGSPDYIYLKCSEFIVFDNLMIDRNRFTYKQGSLKKSKDVDGHPFYYLEAKFNLTFNEKEYTFDSKDEIGDTEGVVLTVDAEAFGLPADQIKYIRVE